MKSLYELKTENWENLKTLGFPNLCEMSKRFDLASSMDSALGCVNATSSWHSGRTVKPSGAAEACAGLWLEANKFRDTAQEPDFDFAEIGLPDGFMSAQETPTTIPQKQLSAIMIVMVPRDGDPSQVVRVLTMLGCSLEVI